MDELLNRIERMIRELEEEARGIRHIPAALHLLVLAKAVKTIASMGGEAPIDDVTRVLREDMDELTAKTWTIVLARRRLAEIRNGRVMLVEEGVALAKRGVLDRVERAAIEYLTLVGWKLK